MIIRKILISLAEYIHTVYLSCEENTVSFLWILHAFWNSASAVYHLYGQLHVTLWWPIINGGRLVVVSHDDFVRNWIKNQWIVISKNYLTLFTLHKFWLYSIHTILLIRWTMWQKFPVDLKKALWNEFYLLLPNHMENLLPSTSPIKSSENRIWKGFFNSIFLGGHSQNLKTWVSMTLFFFIVYLET